MYVSIFYIGAVAVSSGVFGTSGEPASNEISCTGNEANILECNNTAISDCQSPHEAGVACQGMYTFKDLKLFIHVLM